ncbi:MULTISPECIES: SgrR family transcriptional regulator [Paenibacillus]|uniref:SgrR family transcriptional regulator n=1 Tax=Paenibacillus TaxID=44249 RepID=UPI0022B86810|nr:SgrR family transcriptional regulator [Paenibacillus caseinilyticus]MCZ8520320.1 ABC transporter substrate-binding protein [Paenibacillus caseinilyticus]
MQTVLYGLELRRFFGDQETGIPFSVTVDELAGVWYCSPRYAKLIVRSLCREGWIEWQAGRGRGHKSLLTLRKDTDELLLGEVKQRMEQGEVKEAMELLGRFGGPAVKDRFMEWMSEGIGFSTREVSDSLQETLRLPVYRSILTQDPALVYYAFDCHLARQVFNTLVEYDEERRTIVPGIAHAWECRSGAREWTFHLRKNVLFHHGRELTSADVLFTLNRLRLNAQRYAAGWMFRDIEQLEARDRKTVRISLGQPNYLFLKFLSTIGAAIVPEDAVCRDEAQFARMPVGTGPFRWVRRTDGLGVLEAFPPHFRGRPHLDRVEVLIFPEAAAGRLKEPDWTSIMTSHGETSGAQREALRQEGDQWQHMETRFSCCSLLVFNQAKSGPQRDPLFREAFRYLLDREALIDDLGGDRICPAEGFHAQDEGAYAGKPLSGGSPKTRRDILSLLERSGCQGETLELATYPYHEADARWIQARAASFGVSVEVVIRSTAEWADHASLPPADCQLYGIVLGSDEVRELGLYLQRNYFASLWDSRSAEEIRRETAAILREPEESGRRAGLAALERRVRQSHDIVFLVHKTTNAAYHQSVHGVKINSYGWIDFFDIWFY